MLQMKIFDRVIDLIDFDVSFVYEIVTGLGERSANYSFTTTLLNTNVLESIVGCLHSQYDDFTLNKQLNDSNNYYDVFNIFNKNKCQIIEDGNILFDGWFTITQAEGRLNNYQYEITFFGDNMAWLNDSEFQLSEIAGDELCYNAALVSVGITDVMVFPFIEYGNFTNNLSSGMPLVDIENLYPAYYVKNLVRKGFEHIGYTVIDDFFVSNNSQLIIPFSGVFETVLGKMGSQVGIFTNENELWLMGYMGSGNTNFLTNTNYTFIRYFETSTNDLLNVVPLPSLVTFTNDGAYSCGDVELCFKLDYGFRYTDNILAVRQLQFTAQIVSTIDGILVQETTNVNAADYGIYNKSLEFCGKISYNADIFIRFVTRMQAGGVGPIMAVAFDLDLLYNNMTVSHNLTKENFKFNEYANAPALTLRQLMSELVKIFNLIIITDNDTKTVHITDYNLFNTTVDEVNNQNDYVDWSQKVDLSNNITQYYPRLKQVSFNYVEDNDDLSSDYKQLNGVNYGDYVTIINENADDVLQLSLSEFASAQSYTVQFVGTNYIKIFYIINITEQNVTLPVADKTDWKLRLLYYDAYTEGGLYWLLGSNFGATTGVILTFPLCNFTGLEFEDLYNIYYNDYVNMIVNKRLVEMVIDLGASDCNVMVFGKAIYINSAWYKLKKINGYNSNTLTRVELYQL